MKFNSLTTIIVLLTKGNVFYENFSGIVCDVYRTIFHIQNGLVHHENKPAIEGFDKKKWWYKKGKLHREDGPAIIWKNGHQEYWLNGKKYTEENWKEILNKK